MSSIPPAHLTELCAQVLSHYGVTRTDANFVAGSLVESDLRGIHSHGSMRLGRYAKELDAGLTNPNANIVTIEKGSACASVDGNGALGQLVARQALSVGIEKARSAGTASVTCCKSRHFGAAGNYCLMALEENIMAMSMTVSSPRIAPTGGVQPMFGTNPIALGVPGNHDFPLVIDLAMSSVAAGNIELAARAGDVLPKGVARDIAGAPTTDPQEALDGSIVPIGEHKGYALTMLIEILAGLLASSPYFGVSRENVGQHVEEKGIGHFFLCIDPTQFIPLEVFKSQVAEMVSAIKVSPRLPGVKEIFVPGELEEKRRRHRLKHGIPLAESTRSILNSLGQKCGVDNSLYI